MTSTKALGNSRSISTNQLGPHEKLPELVKRHLAHQSQKPFNAHTVEAFEQVQKWRDTLDPLKSRPLIIDACCGVGESTVHIAKTHPSALVIGIDKSDLRTNKHDHYKEAEQSDEGQNYRVIRADLNDFWRLARNTQWQLSKHYLLYPNPYPKSAHVQRRWHGSAAFADIIALGGTLEVRSNWQIYIEEFAQALSIAGFATQAVPYKNTTAQTPFERKYWASGQTSWHLQCQL